MSRRRRYSTQSTLSSATILVIVFLLMLVVAIISAVLRFLADNLWIIKILIVITATVSIVYAIVHLTKTRYTKIATYTSPGVKALNILNLKYRFGYTTNQNMLNSYDNENFYNDISPEDYLTYQLVYQQNQINEDIKVAHRNSLSYPDYVKEVETIKEEFYNFLPPDVFFKNAFKKIHQNVFNSKIQYPKTVFKIDVVLRLTKINGEYVTSKTGTFYEDDIKRIIKGLKNTQNGYYLDDSIWQSICRVERGKVTNKIRFAVYARDGHRCRECGSSYDLEVDHIFPISKGGKSTFDNLQTLCHRCNSMKSNTVTAYTINRYAQTHQQAKNICPQCKRGLLVLRNGKNGSFYGCSNYPNCKFTKNL